jgi:hypothetical protein
LPELKYGGPRVAQDVALLLDKVTEGDERRFRVYGREGPSWAVPCPLKDCDSDEDALSIDIVCRDGRWKPLFWCRRCSRGRPRGQYIERLAEFAGVPSRIIQDPGRWADRSAQREFREHLTRHPPREVTREAIEAMQAALRKRPDVMSYLRAERGLTHKGLARYRLGWDRGHIVLPVWEPQRDGFWLKKRGWPEKSSRNARGSVATLYPRSLDPFSPSLRLLDGYAVLVAGEFDALLLRRHGLPALTSTNGCLGWTPDLVAELIGAGLREAAVIFDVGEEEAASGLVENLASRGVDAWRVDLRGMRGLARMRGGEDVPDAIIRYKVAPDALCQHIEDQHP